MPLLLLRVWSWLKTAWEWLKKHWWAVLPPLAALFVLERFARRPKVLAPSSVDASRFQLTEEQKAQQARAEAAYQRLQDLKKIDEAHKKTLDNLSDEQREQAAELIDEPEKLNEYLLKVGKDIRS